MLRVAFWASFPMAKELRDIVSEAVDQAMKDGLKEAESDGGEEALRLASAS